VKLYETSEVVLMFCVRASFRASEGFKVCMLQRGFTDDGILSYAVVISECMPHLHEDCAPELASLAWGPVAPPHALEATC
jgi:hypothetical protein